MEGKVAVIKEGYTLMHEHITIDLSGVKKDLAVFWKSQYVF